MAEKKYKLKEVCIRLAEGNPLYSDVPLSSPGAALQVMRKEMEQFARECLCVVNLNTKLQPINFNIVSVGELNQSIAAIPNILKSGLMSNAEEIFRVAEPNTTEGGTKKKQKKPLTNYIARDIV